MSSASLTPDTAVLHAVFALDATQDALPAHERVGRYVLCKPGAALPEDSRAASRKMGGQVFGLLRHEILEKVGRLEPLAREAGLSMPQFALAWILRRPEVSSAIIGATKPEQAPQR